MLYTVRAVPVHGTRPRKRQRAMEGFGKAEAEHMPLVNIRLNQQPLNPPGLIWSHSCEDYVGAGN